LGCCILRMIIILPCRGMIQSLTLRNSGLEIRQCKRWIAGLTDSSSLRMCATILAEETIACIRAASRRPERSQAAAERPLLCRALGLALNDRYVRTSCPFSGNRYGCTLHIPPCVRVSARLQESPHLFYQLPPRLARGANPESGHAQFISFPGFLGHAAFT
jgi:hypothetical protein